METNLETGIPSIQLTASHQLPYEAPIVDSPSFDLPTLPEDIHCHFDVPDEAFSALTLHVLEDYLNADIKAQIRAELISKEERTEGVPAFQSEMITSDDRRCYAVIENNGDDHVFFTVDNCNFVLNDVRRLRPGYWLNDNIVNGYMKLLQLRDQQAVVSLSCHFCKTFLINHIYPTYSYNRVRKWTMEKRLKNWGQKQPTIMECDLVFFPVNQSNIHWVLVVADLKKKVIRYYDSMDTTIVQAEQLMTNIAQYLRDEARDKLGSDEDFTEFRFEYGKIPSQSNTSDCGVFVARSAKELGGGHHLNFNVQEMKDYRILIFKELSSGHVL